MVNVTTPGDDPMTPIETGVRELTKLASEMRGERDDAPILTLKAAAPTSAA